MKPFDRLLANRKADTGAEAEMSQATAEYDYDSDDSDSSELFLRGPQRMRAPQKDRAKNFMKDGVDQSVNTSSAACSSVEIKAASTTYSSAKKKSQVIQLPPPRCNESSISSTSSEQESQSAPPERKYIKLPAGYLRQCNDCDEAEKLARKRRCDELISLSEKIVRDAKEAANRQPLKWAEPTFNPFSSSDTNESHTVLQQDRSNAVCQTALQEVQEEAIECDPPFRKRRRSDGLSDN